MCQFQRLSKVLCILFVLYPLGGAAHHTDEHAVVLHTNDKWEDCAIVLDPSLTQAQWETFTRDISSIIYFRPTNGAKPLGKGNFDVALELSSTEPLKDYQGSWNNTFSHPDDEHWLVGDSHRLELPVIVVRAGVTDKVDVGFVYTNNFAANYGWVGIDTKFAFYHNPANQLHAATRLSLVSLTGVDDLNYYQGVVDILVSKKIGWFVPYAGIAGLYSIANEATDKVELDRVDALTAEAIIGTQFNWKYLSMAAEVDAAKISMLTFKLGVTF